MTTALVHHGSEDATASKALIRITGDLLEKQADAISLPVAALEMKNGALIRAAAIGAVVDPESNALAVEAQIALKAAESLFEKARVEATKPILEAQRTLKAFVDKHREPLLAELVRVSRIIGNYQALLESQRRDAEAAQRKELEEAERLKREEMAKAPTLEAREAIAEKHEQVAAAIQAAPIPAPVRAAGQRVQIGLAVTITNKFELCRLRPDLVREITFDMLAIKDELKRGVKLPGVTAEEELKAGVRLTPQSKVIDV